MLKQSFDSMRLRLEKQYESAVFPQESGWSEAQLRAAYAEHREKNPSESRLLQRAYLQSLLMRHAPVALEAENPVAGKMQTFGMLQEDLAEGGVLAKKICPEVDIVGEDFKLGISWRVDRSHVAPDWEAIVQMGIHGLLKRARNGSSELHLAAVMVLEALAEFCRRAGKLNGNLALEKVADHVPATLHEAFELTYVFHEMIEYGNVEVRTMGRFDALYLPFYRASRAAGMSRDEAKKLLKYFWLAFYAKYQGKRFGKNFCFGPDFNELSYLGMEVFYEMNIVDPKLSILFRKDMPQDFLELYARCIRDGRTSIVTLNYEVVVEGMIRHGHTPEDSRNFIPIGCYEPAVAGKEIALSGCSLLNLPIILLNTLERQDDFPDFEELMTRYLKRIEEVCSILRDRQILCDRVWKYLNPAPLFSCTFESCMRKGLDITEAGADYNNTGNVVAYLADAVDSLAAIRFLVFQKKLCTFPELKKILNADWKGYERLRQMVRTQAPKWGNDDDQIDPLAIRIAAHCSKVLSALTNGRNGRFYPSIYGQMVVENGSGVGALPDGRKAGEPLSKNMDACIPMDRNGITALMNSVLKIDMTQFPCGTCLDLMLHPSSVTGPEGIQVLAALIRKFIRRGGSGIQFNIFDAQLLRDAQKHPEKYENLQVRVCGWNVKFNDLSPKSQETFIRQAEAIA